MGCLNHTRADMVQVLNLQDDGILGFKIKDLAPITKDLGSRAEIENRKLRAWVQKLKIWTYRIRDPKLGPGTLNLEYGT